MEKNRKNLLPKKKTTVMMTLNVLAPSGQWALEAMFAAGVTARLGVLILRMSVEMVTMVKNK